MPDGLLLGVCQRYETGYGGGGLPPGWFAMSAARSQALCQVWP